jgi:monoamine oxidase
VNTKTDVLVLGGGVSGLAAAGDLARAGFRVTLLEARRRLGGRILTRRPPGWAGPVEEGAEFIHGGNRALWELLRRSGIRVHRLRDRHCIGRDGAIRRLGDLDRRIASVTGLIRPAKAGRLSFGAYFRRYPPAVDADTWSLARGFIEGFEAAPLDAFSARAVSGESLDEEHQYALPGGYDQVVDVLAGAAVAAGVRILTGSPVRAVRWRRGRVAATAGSGRRFAGRAAVVALPLGVLKARAGRGAVRFSPDPTAARRAIEAIGLGHVVRMAFRFQPRFIRSLPPALRPPRGDGFGFLHVPGEVVPVWWSLSDEPLLVAWAGGPAAAALLARPPSSRRSAALRSLARALGQPASRVAGAVTGWATHDWSGDPFSRGAYSYPAAGHDGAADVLRKPVASTLFFCGEAAAEGPEVGTVHGALASGLRAARYLRQALGRPIA